MFELPLDLLLHVRCYHCTYVDLLILLLPQPEQRTITGECPLNFGIGGKYNIEIYIQPNLGNPIMLIVGYEASALVLWKTNISTLFNLI